MRNANTTQSLSILGQPRSAFSECFPCSYYRTCSSETQSTHSVQSLSSYCTNASISPRGESLSNSTRPSTSFSRTTDVLPPTIGFTITTQNLHTIWRAVFNFTQCRIKGDARRCCSTRARSFLGPAIGGSGKILTVQTDSHYSSG